MSKYVTGTCVRGYEDLESDSVVGLTLQHSQVVTLQDEVLKGER